jgi:sulfhydrogenase subunit beta (sulfur reductase)
MSATQSESATESADSEFLLPKAQLQQLLVLLKERGYVVIGPRIWQEAIVYDEIVSVDDLPRGWTDQQQPGGYRLARRDDDAWFGYVVGPHSWKRYLFPPLTTVAVADRTGTGWEMKTPTEPVPRYAFLGVRACELAAMKIQDRVFLEGAYIDPIYQARREQALIIAVNCTLAGTNCFCTSMNAGPRCRRGFDLALTELPDAFLIEVGSETGREIVSTLQARVAEAEESQAAEQARQQAELQITKRLDTTDIRNLLLSNLDHPRWAEVATRCLSCTNCTMVCPTCFCSSVNEVSDLQGDHIERHRQWDSCFNLDFSYMNGGHIRNDTRSRYRQWMTHKLASWIDQFGSSGCVGCGRCVTWCPVGIDLTVEVAAIRGATA